ncbi:hypothetical protein ACFX1Q_020450 [Malus domestica]
MAGEDSAFCQQLIPGIMLSIGIRNEEAGLVDSPHSCYFFLDEDVLLVGAALHAALAESYLDKHQHSSKSSLEQCLGNRGEERARGPVDNPPALESPSEGGSPSTRGNEFWSYKNGNRRVTVTTPLVKCPQWETMHMGLAR